MGEPDINLAKIELPVAPQDAARVVDALIDLFSPVTEAMGVVGDQVRMYRTNAVLRTLGETKRLAEAAGYRLRRPPLRFLAPFLEEASLQGEDDDPALQTMWANLLLQASQDDGKASRMIVDIMGRLSSNDAKNLERVVRNPRWTRKSINQIVDVAFEYDHFDLGDLLNDTIQNRQKPDDLEPDGTEEKAIEIIIHRAEDRGIIVSECGFYSFAERQAWDVVEIHPDFPNSEDLSLHSLAALGLLKYPLVRGRPYRGGHFSMTLCVLTALGAEFYLSTHDPSLREAGSELPPFEN